MSKEIIGKMVKEAVAAVKAPRDVVKEKRGTNFTIEDAQPYVDAVNAMEPAGKQSEEIYDLHKKSVNIHYDILKEIAKDKTIRPEDDPFVEHYQTPPILEILYDAVPEFRESMEKFIDAIGKNEAFLGKYAVKRYGGMFGMTCVVDFAMSSGSTSAAVNHILREIDIPQNHKEAILAAKSWGMNTSYGIGAAFTQAIENGKSVADAADAEIERLKFIYDKPVDGQATIMDELGQESFDHRDYMSKYKEQIKPVIRKALDANVHLGNMLVIPAYGVGTVGHHIAQSTYNMCKDDVIMATIDAVDDVLINTLEANVEKFEDQRSVLSAATGSTAAATTHILSLDNMTVPMVLDLLNKRFQNLIVENPGRSQAAELHNVDFSDMLVRGEDIMTPVWQHKVDKPQVAGVEVDLSPVDENEILQNPQRYTYPGCAITVRFSALMRLADFPCLLTTEECTATLMTNITAEHPEKVDAPVKYCKNCAYSYYTNKRPYCEWHKAI